MAIYYVKWDATGAANGASWTNAYSTVSAAVAAHNQVGDVIEISGGVSGHLYNESVNAQYGRALEIRGSSAPGHDGQVSISSAGLGLPCLRIDVQTLSNLKIYGADSTKPNLVSNNAGVLNDCYLGDSSVDLVMAPDRRNIEKGGIGTLTINNSRISYSGTMNNISAYGGAIIFNRSIVSKNNGIIASSINLTFNNCSIVGNCIKNNAATVDMSSTGNATFNNCLLYGNGGFDQSRESVRTTGTGTITYKNCNLLPGQPSSTGGVYEYTGIKNDCIASPPRVVRNRRLGFASIIIDDYESLQYFYDVVTEIDVLGVSCAIALSRPGLVTYETWGILRDHVAAGHEVLNHTMTHFNFNGSTAISITGPVNSSISFVPDVSSTDPTLWGGVLTLLENAVEVRTIDVSAVGSFATPNLVAANINGFGSGWSATAVTNAGSTLFACCSALTGQSTVSAHTMQLNMAKIVYYEIGWAKKIIEENLGIECKCFAYPGGGFTATVKTLINDAANYPPDTNKHILARSLGNANQRSYSLASDIPSGSGLKTGWQVFEAHSLHLAAVAGASATDAQITTRVGGWGEALQCIGAVGMTYLHKNTTDGANYYTPQMVKVATQALLSSGITVANPTAIMNHVLNSGLYTDADGDGSRWTRVFADDEDYHLQPTSPCIGAGTAIAGITTDIEGNQLYPPYNIGPYGIADGALGVAPVTSQGSIKSNLTEISGPGGKLDPAGTYRLADTNAARVAVGFVYGVDHWAFTSTGIPKEILGSVLIANGIGYRFYVGTKGIVGYSVDQDAKSHARIVKALKVPTYFDSLLYDVEKDYTW